jgi:5,10-methylenetetrahydrofolate reductase
VALGGVLIAERHERSLGEADRIIAKQDDGCSFFITQAVYSSVATKNVFSDLYYRCCETGRDIPPVLMTLSPCGSRKTLEFMRWLGISIPRWLENELLHAKDILGRSLKLCEEVFLDVNDFALSKGIPLGCNVESVSVRKEEIEASVELTRFVARQMNREIP